MKTRIDNALVLLVIGLIVVLVAWGVAHVFAGISEVVEAMREWMLQPPQVFIAFSISVILGFLIPQSRTEVSTDAASKAEQRTGKKGDLQQGYSPMTRRLICTVVMPLILAVLLACGWLVFDLLGVSAANWVAKWCRLILHQGTESWTVTIVAVIVLVVVGWLFGAIEEEVEKNARSTPPSAAESCAAEEE